MTKVVLDPSKGDIYQQFADQTGMSRTEAKGWLFPYIYGSLKVTTEPITIEFQGHAPNRSAAEIEADLAEKRKRWIQEVKDAQ